MLRIKAFPKFSDFDISRNFKGIESRVFESKGLQREIFSGHNIDTNFSIESIQHAGFTSAIESQDK